MDKSKVYIGVYKENNQEALFYQKDRYIFYDLKQKKNVFFDEIQENSLIPYSNIIKCMSNFKRNIIKLYDLDRMQEISLNRVFIGNVYELEDVTTTVFFNHVVKNLILNMEKSTTSSIKLVKKGCIIIFYV